MSTQVESDFRELLEDSAKFLETCDGAGNFYFRVVLKRG